MIETIKTIMQTTRPRIMEGFTNGSGCRFFLKKIFDQVKRFRSELFYSNQNVTTTSHIIFTI